MWEALPGSKPGSVLAKGGSQGRSAARGPGANLEIQSLVGAALRRDLHEINIGLAG